MVGSIDVSPDGSCLLVSFPYREDLVNLVRNIPGRRWDRSTKTWKVPIGQVERTVKTFLAYGFHLSPEVTAALATGGEPGAHGTAELEAVDRKSASLTISALNLRIAEALRGALSEPVWVIGELQNFDKARRGRHLYFDLVERESDAPDARAVAVLPAVVLEKNWALMRRRLARFRDVELADGVKVRVHGTVDFYQPRGRVQFKIDDIDPAYTLGEQVVKRERILAKLEEEGLRKRQLELPLPLVPLRIALLTSFGSDAYNDVVQTLNDEGFRFEITVFDCYVQGDRLRPSVLAGLSWFAENAADYDLLLIVRGGGSRSELVAWDDLEVARAVARHPLKAVIGIGHERDRCVLDEIALSVKTPTAAGELVLERCRAYQEAVEDRWLRIAELAERLANDERRGLIRRATLLRHQVTAALAGAAAELTHKRAVFHGAVRRRLAAAAFETERAAGRLVSAAPRLLARAAERLEGLQKQVKALDPKRVLARGFALLRRPGGRVLAAAADAKRGEHLEAELKDGRLDLRVEGSAPAPDSTKD